MKSKVRVLAAIFLLSLLLCACGEKEPDWPGYHGTMEEYEYFYTEGRDRMWEEDILFIAESFLSGHPKLADSNFYTKILLDFAGGMDYEYSNAHFDEELRREFIDQFSQLIPRISELDDFGIRYEASRIVALLEDGHAGVNMDAGDLLPFCFEPIGQESEFQMCTIRVPVEYAYLLGSRLTAINGIPVEQIVSDMSEYLSCENPYWTVHQVVRPRESPMLTQKPALRAIGAVEPDAQEAVLSFETGNGTVTETVEFVPTYVFVYMDMVEHDMTTDLSLVNQREDNFWYTVDHDADEPYIYVRFQKMDQSDMEYNRFYTMIESELKNAETPLKLIVDFRDNPGGDLQVGVSNGFAQNVNRYGTNGSYILINRGTFSAAMTTSYVLANTIEGAKLVGSPTGQFVNSFGGAYPSYTPNFNTAFNVPDYFICGAPGQESDAIYPDITVYQTWEDYQNNTDTVLEYVLGLD